MQKNEWIFWKTYMNFNLLLGNISYFFLVWGCCDWTRAINWPSITSFPSNTKLGANLFKFCFETNWERILIALECSIVAFTKNRMSAFSTQNDLVPFSFFFPVSSNSNLCSSSELTFPHPRLASSVLKTDSVGLQNDKHLYLFDFYLLISFYF